MEIRKVVRAGGSLVIALPKTYTRILKIISGSHCEIRLVKGESLLLTPLKQHRQPTQNGEEKNAADERIQG